MTKNYNITLHDSYIEISGTKENIKLLIDNWIEEDRIEKFYGYKVMGIRVCGDEQYLYTLLKNIYNIVDTCITIY